VERWRRRRLRGREAERWRGGCGGGGPVEVAAAVGRWRRRLGLERVGDLLAVWVGFDRGEVLNWPRVVSPDSSAM
jgi:hypothetical protein